jgi:hypothetical protein
VIDEQTLTRGLHDLAERHEPGAPPVAALLRRGRRTRIGRAAGVFATAAVLAVGSVYALTGVPPSGTQPVPLALAAQTTELTTFRFHEEGMTVEGLGGAGPTLPVDGAVDPVNRRGFAIAKWDGRRISEIRQFGDTCYSGFSPPDGPDRWHRAPCGNDAMMQDPQSQALGRSASPGPLLKELREAGDVTHEGRSGSGADAVDTYRFSYAFTRVTYSERPDNQGTRSGTVQVSVSTHRIVAVRYRTKYDARRTEFTTDLRLFDFGTPVEVEAPTVTD